MKVSVRPHVVILLVGTNRSWGGWRLAELTFSKKSSPGGDQSPGMELRRDGDGFCNSDIPPVGCQHLWGHFCNAGEYLRW